MRFIIKPWTIASLTIFALTGAGIAIAQDGSDAVTHPAGTQNVNGGEDVSLSPKDMLEKARGMVPEMDQARATVAEQLADAKKKKDVVKSLCPRIRRKIVSSRLRLQSARAIPIVRSTSSPSSKYCANACRRWLPKRSSVSVRIPASLATRTSRWISILRSPIQIPPIFRMTLW